MKQFSMALLAQKFFFSFETGGRPNAHRKGEGEGREVEKEKGEKNNK